ncbi:ABC transporter ATP-binding protein [Solwaraspora sp. WMMD791]|uniref:ABC transporter ATP-binding protein n=1 Tax=Solwaraspora sp. WMMD791 TaxID=3016086 RepID=UPI002499F279|nr:ABC transporter ATP-binding protein [Solwaraspora sp. WMMD791]WFE30842.1 ABC transporter ATP-binding protein [Solwaraspora sp. WMMD791]
MVRVDGVSRDFHGGGRVVHALRDVSLRVSRGELVAVQGRSGAGKTTLLNLIGGLDQPTAGTVRVAGREVSAATEAQLVELRRSTIGFVFQSFGLIPILSAAENVGVPLRLAKVSYAEREQRVALLLELVGLGGQARQRPYELSGGQQQRVAIARALANDPPLLIADEPTAQLDSETGRSIMDLIRSLVRARGMAAVVATHDPALIELADRAVSLRDGALADPVPAVGADPGCTAAPAPTGP